MSLLQKLNDKIDVKKFCLVTTVLGTATVFSGQKANASGDFDRFKRKVLSTNNLGKNKLAKTETKKIKEEKKVKVVSLNVISTEYKQGAEVLADIETSAGNSKEVSTSDFARFQRRSFAKNNLSKLSATADREPQVSYKVEKKKAVNESETLEVQAANLEPALKYNPVENRFEYIAKQLSNEKPIELAALEPLTGEPEITSNPSEEKFVFEGAKPAEVKAVEIGAEDLITGEDKLFDADDFNDVVEFNEGEAIPLSEKEVELLEGFEKLENFNSGDFQELEEDAQYLEDNLEDFSDNYLLLKVSSGKLVLNQGMSGYDVGGRLYISLYELVETIYFPIKVFDEEKRAEGWFIEEGNDFYLSLDNEELIIKGRKVDLSNNDVKIIDEEIYVSSNSLKDWFGLSFNLNYSRLTLDIESTEKLEFEKKLERDNRWQRSTTAQRQRKTYPKKELPYKMLELPSSTVLLNSNYTSVQGKETLTGSYAVQGSGDLLGMTSEYFLTGNEEEDISETRIKLYRYDNDGVFEGSDIRQFEIGDVNSARLNLAGGGSSERGVRLTNKALGTVSTPDNVLIEGEVEPGWDVELYRNNEFIAFQEDTSSGRYEFSGLSLQGGMNLFKVIKYGPFGEVEEELQRYFIGPGMLKEGELHYEFSASQVDRRVLPNTIGGYEVSGDHRVVGNAEYGISDSLSVGTGFYSGPILDENRDALLFSGRASILGMFNRVDYLANDDGTAIGSFSNRLNVGGFNFSTFAKYNDGFDESEEDTLLESNFDVATNLNLFGLAQFNIRLGAELEDYQTAVNRYAYTKQVSTNISGFSLSNKLDWDIQGQNEQIDGEFFFRKRLGDFVFNSKHDFLIRTNLTYRVDPIKDIDSLNVRLEKNVNEDTRLRFNVANSFGQSKKTTYGLGVNHTGEYFSTGINTTYDSDGDMSAGINFRFNIGQGYDDQIDFIKNNRAQRGSIKTLTYLDNNNNSKYDGGDSPIEGVNYKSRFGSKATSNEDGVAMVGGLTGYKTDEVYIDTNTLPDIFYVPPNEGYTVIPRPGNTSYIEFPVVVGGEVDGFIELDSKQLNNTYDFSVFGFDLINDKGEVVRDLFADESGYYLIERVIPGKYKLVMKQESVDFTGYQGQTEREIVIEGEDPVITDLNFEGSFGEAESDSEESAEQQENVTDKELAPQ